MTLNPFKAFSTFLRPYRKSIVLGLGLLLGVQGISMSIPMVLKWAIDAAKDGLEAGGLAAQFAKGELAQFAGLIAGLALLHWFMSLGTRWYLTATSRRVERDIRRAYVRHVMQLPLAFFQQRQVGDLMARATNDVEAIQRFLSHAFRTSLTAVLSFVLSLILMGVIDWQLAVYALLPMPVMVASTRWVSEKVRRGFRQVQEQFAAMSVRIQENLAGIRVVKAFALRRAETQRFDHLNQTYVDRNRRLVYIRSLYFPFTFLINGLSMLVILWIGGLRVIEGTLTLGAFVAFNAYLIRMGRPMTRLGRIVDEYQRALASMTRINAVLAVEPQTGEAGLAAEGPPIRGEIEFRHAHFAYNGQEVLRDINVRIPAGGTLAVVGRVGAGKTTLARLLPRLIEPGEGQVFIDGVPVEEMPLAVLRQAIGYVPQETFLFSDTIRDNIDLEGAENGVAQYDAERAKNGAVQKAAEVAQLTPDLQSLPLGMETVVGERGVTLSGGQKQRTALARAIIRHPQILILDDALASVDTRTEEEILRHLRQVMASRTTIIIAHRISTIKDADHILVLDDGTVAEEGTHGELVERRGIYADMYRRQHLAQELSDL